MSTTKDDLHRLVDQLPIEVTEAVRRALLAAANRAGADVQQHQDRIDELAQLSSQELEERPEELLRLAADLDALAVRLRQVEWISPEFQRGVQQMQETAIELVARARQRQFADWQSIEAAHARGEVQDSLLLALLNAPEDDEPVSSDEEAAIAEAREDVHAGRTRTWDEVRRELEAEAANG